MTRSSQTWARNDTLAPLFLRHDNRRGKPAGRVFRPWSSLRFVTFAKLDEFGGGMTELSEASCVVGDLFT